ncbi:uncharacterized protein LOC114522618 [Dendronephthya gigantea]|uniref:uncharacterized protein LOC114522618 n=1 Tax=Dendronephthya gigantea TaxID=151771 RepID=UPI001069F5B2|nr:uncharacterized protein LOC114522618 [Dendronephthya gigantea]
MFSFVLLGEVFYLCQRWKIFQFHRTVAWDSDEGFVIDYFLRKPYISCEKGIEIYKKSVLNREKRTGLGNLYVDVVAQNDRSPPGFSQQMSTSTEDVLKGNAKLPPNAVRLETVKDLFSPNKDTKGEFPLTILVIGQPGIGKSSLAEKVMADWANEIDGYYRDKIVFLINFTLFVGKKNENFTLKQFLQLGTRLSNRLFRDS